MDMVSKTRHFIKNRDILAFVHIEKAAGTTLIDILRHNFCVTYCDVRPLSRHSGPSFTAKDMKQTLVINPFVQCIAGHSIRPYLALSGAVPNMRYITLMRDPCSRYVSQYQYWIERMGVQLTFDQFLELEDVSNFQTKKISGSNDLPLAKEILRKHFLLVGTLEQFDEFLVLLKKKLYPFKFDPRYRVKNVTQSRTMRQEILSTYRDRILENNQLDIALYNFISKTLVPESLKWYGPNFENDLAHFKMSNMNSSPSMRRRYVAQCLEKLYYKPVSGLIRVLNGLPALGSYGAKHLPL